MKYRLNRFVLRRRRMEEPGSIAILSPPGHKSRIILYLVILSILSILISFAKKLSTTDQPYMTLSKWNYKHFFTTYAAEAASGPEKDGRYTHHNQTTTPHQAKGPDYDIICRSDEYTVWEEWRSCIIQYLVGTRWTKENEGGASPCNVTRNLPAVNTVFEEFILQQSDLLPWSSPSNVTVVLLEFRALDRRMAFTIKNAMDNLPVHWPIQVVGGPSICVLATSLFPVEVAAGKIVLTDLGIDAQTHVQDQISKLYTDINFYEKLLGDTWLFIQHDSVICKQQRHLMKGFIAKDRGWWGAPWSFWDWEPAMCGNGGFSLRKRGFVEFMLKRFSWDGALAEDLWICYKSIDIYHELPDEFKPANMSDEMSFASETIPSESPFGLHKFWPWLQPHVPEVRTSLENCPEALGIFPPELLDSHSGWHDLICSLDVAWESFDQRTNITFDYKAHCGPN